MYNMLCVIDAINDFVAGDGALSTPGSVEVGGRIACLLGGRHCYHYVLVFSDLHKEGSHAVYGTVGQLVDSRISLALKHSNGTSIYFYAKHGDDEYEASELVRRFELPLDKSRIDVCGVNVGIYYEALLRRYGSIVHMLDGLCCEVNTG